MVLAACQSGKSDYFEGIKKSDEGHLRGITIGSAIEEVKASEDATFLKEEMPDYLHYDYPISMGNSFTVTYDFSSENKCYEIEQAVFLDKIEDAASLFSDYEAFFTRKYGKGRLADDGFMIWTHKTAQLNIEVAMINDSESYGYLSIFIRDLDY